MSCLTLPTYRGYGRDVTIDVTRVTHWERVDYNGNAGVEIHLDTGKTVTVEGAMHEVGRRIAAAKDALVRSQEKRPVEIPAGTVIAARALLSQLGQQRPELDTDLVMVLAASVVELATD